MREIRERLDAIRTEAVRLTVFANTTDDLALADNLKKIAGVVFRDASAIERRLTKLK
jgi:hypothetical protein